MVIDGEPRAEAPLLVRSDLPESEPLLGRGGLEATKDDGPVVHKLEIASAPKKATAPPQLQVTVTEADETGTKLRLLTTHFFARTDKIAAVAPWEKACPVSTSHPDGPLEDVLRGHLDGKTSPWVCFTSQAGKVTWIVGPNRIGSYCLGDDARVLWTCVDFDGGTSHKFPLADARAAAMTTIENLSALGVGAYLERSGGGSGWHVWVFFSEPIPAALARQLGHQVVPLDAPLAKGGVADPKAGKGIEVNPKQDHINEGGYGNLVWLPWWHGAPEGANEFYKIDDAGQLHRYLPDALVTMSRSFVEGIVGDVPIAPRKPMRSVTGAAIRKMPSIHVDDVVVGANDIAALLKIMEELPIYRWAVEKAEDVTRECWRGLGVNIAAAVVDDPGMHEAGAELFHRISAADADRYNHRACQTQFLDCLKSARTPMTYATLKENGAPDEVCPDTEEAKAPVVHARRLLARNEQDDPSIEIGDVLPDVVRALIAKHPRLGNLFNGEGKPGADKNGRRLDTTPNGYDRSFVGSLVHKGITDENVLATALAMRPGGHAKALGRAYIVSTVRSVLAWAAKTLTPTTAGSSGAGGSSGAPPPAAASAPAPGSGGPLSFTVTEVKVYRGDKVRCELLINGTWCSFESDELIDMKLFRRRFFQQMLGTPSLPPSTPKGKVLWDIDVNSWMAMATVIELPSDASLDGAIRAAVQRAVEELQVSDEARDLGDGKAYDLKDRRIFKTATIERHVKVRVPLATSEAVARHLYEQGYREKTHRIGKGTKGTARAWSAKLPALASKTKRKSAAAAPLVSPSTTTSSSPVSTIVLPVTAVPTRAAVTPGYKEFDDNDGNPNFGPDLPGGAA